MQYLKTFILMTGLMLLFLWIGSFFGENGLLFALILGGVMNIGAYWFSDKIVLKMNRAQKADEGSYPALFQMIRSLSQKAGLPMPTLYIIPMPTPNAFATGRDPNHAVVAVSPSLIEALSSSELEGVLAHELAHIKNRDILIATIAACLAGAITYLAHLAQWGAIFGGYGGREQRDSNPFGLLLMAIVTPIAALLIQMAISRSREYAADKKAAEMTRQPMALANALQKIHSVAMAKPVQVEPATASLYIANPMGKLKNLQSFFSTHPPMEERVKRLKAMPTSPPSGDISQP